MHLVQPTVADNASVAVGPPIPIGGEDRLAAAKKSHHPSPSNSDRKSHNKSSALSSTSNNSSKPDSGRNVYIASLPNTYTNAKLLDLFRPFGEIVQYSLKVSDEGTYNGYGFVLYKSKESAKQAVCVLHNCIVEGSCVQVRMARREATIKALYHPPPPYPKQQKQGEGKVTKQGKQSQQPQQPPPQYSSAPAPPAYSPPSATASPVQGIVPTTPTSAAPAAAAPPPPPAVAPAQPCYHPFFAPGAPVLQKTQQLCSAAIQWVTGVDGTLYVGGPAVPGDEQALASSSPFYVLAPFFPSYAMPQAMII